MAEMAEALARKIAGKEERLVRRYTRQWAYEQAQPRVSYKQMTKVYKLLNETFERVWNERHEGKHSMWLNFFRNSTIVPGIRNLVVWATDLVILDQIRKETTGLKWGIVKTSGKGFSMSLRYTSRNH